jgi:signal recognition particle subunit SRP19
VRKQDKVIIWPVYFDQSKTRKNGRRIAKSLAVFNPKIDEIAKAVEQLGFKHEVSAELGYPRTPWLKTGFVLVEKKGSKEQVIKKIASELSRIRNEAHKK